MSYIYPVSGTTPCQYKMYYPYCNKKIYIGLYSSIEEATEAFHYITELLSSTKTIEDFCDDPISFKKYISLLNFRDNHIFIHCPIYIFGNYFKYYLSQEIVLTFDIKDLLFFSTYKIYKRGNYFYTKNAMAQTNLLSRYGIKHHSVYGKDYICKNNDCYDFRRENLCILNAYEGVTCSLRYHHLVYVTKIFTHQTMVVGHYKSELEAAIAYNKACDLVSTKTITREYTKNSFPFLTGQEYDALYQRIPVSCRLVSPAPHKKVTSIKTYRGICKDKNGFKAIIGYKGKQIYLGRYSTEKRAAQAYNLASFYLYGKNAYINQVSPLTYNGDEISIADKLKKIGVLKSAPPTL